MDPQDVDSGNPFPLVVSPFDLNPHVQAYRLIQVEKEMKEIKRTQHDILEIVHDIRNAPAIRNPCPTPGLCTDMEPRVKTLELAKAEQSGAWKSVAVISSVVSFALTFLGVSIFKK